MSQQIPSHNPTCLEDIVMWTWTTGQTKFVPYEKDGYLWYYVVGDEDNHTQWFSVASAKWSYFDIFTRVGYSPLYSLHGPMQPPPSPVILKIRHMERKFNERVRHA